MIKQSIEVHRYESPFVWNGPGWFTGSLGGNGALFIGGLQYFAHSAFVGSIWILCYFIAALATFVLWQFRSTINAYQRVQIGIGVFWICWLIAFSTAIFMRPDLIAVVSSSPRSPFQKWLLSTIAEKPVFGLLPLLIFPLAMFLFHRLNQSQTFENENS